MKQEDVLGKKFLVIVAHPDDESFLAAGILHANKMQGGHNFVLCASRGELGYSYMKLKLPTSKIKNLREKELVEAGKSVGVDGIKVLNFPDGNMSSLEENLEKEVNDFVSIQDFDFIVSFGEDGYTGHSDHIVIHKIAKRASAIYGVPFIQFARPPINICGNFDKLMNVKRRNGIYEDSCGAKVKPNLRVTIDPQVKLNALSCHKSQFAGLDPYKIFPKKVAEHFLKNEYFYVSKNKKDVKRKKL